MRVGRGDFSRGSEGAVVVSLLLLLMRLQRDWVFWLRVRAGEGEVRERGGEAMLRPKRVSGRVRDGSGEIVPECSILCTTVWLLEPECWERGLVTLPTNDCRGSTIVRSYVGIALGLVSALVMTGF